MSRKENQVIAEFIELYRSEPCLWKLKIPEYHDRTRKDVSSKLILWTEELNCPFVDLSVSSSNCTVGLHRTICAVITARVGRGLQFKNCTV